jgi:methyl-accepting chemotaxis protein
MNWLNQVSFKYKLAFPVTIIVLAFSLLISQVFFVANEQAKTNTILREHVQPVLDDLEDAYRDMYQLMNAGMGLALASAENEEGIKLHTFNFYDNADKAGPRVATVYKLIDSGFLDGSLRPEVDLLARELKSWRDRYEFMVKNPAQAADYYRQNEIALETTFEAIRKQLKVIRKAIEKNRAAMTNKVEAHAARTNQMLLWGTLVVILLSAAMTWVLVKMLLNPMHRLTGTLQEIAAGDGDLTSRVEVLGNDEIAKLGGAFNTFADKIHNTVSRVIAASHRVRTGAEELTALNRQILSASQSQQDQSDQIATAINELSATTHTVSENANDASVATQDIYTQADHVQATLNDAMGAMTQLVAEIQNSSDIVSTLEQNVESIASILDVIRGIAEQTNLLALNAAIEAARAGEQGRGFAVVADEVRSLASKTQASTGEIQHMIEQLQSTAKQSVSAMQTSSSVGNRTVEHAQQTNTSLEAMNTAIAVINEMNDHMATAANEQNHVTTDLNRNIQSIVDSCNQTLAHVQNAQSACQSLANESGELDQLMSQFKV